MNIKKYLKKMKTILKKSWDYLSETKLANMTDEERREKF